LLHSLIPLVLSLSPAAAYAKPELLIEPADLARATDVVLLDVRGKPNYLEGHVPGAVWVDATAWGKAFTPQPDADAWAKRIGEQGIGLDSKVVVHGGEDVRDAARVWWILRYWGVKDVRLLNGGFLAWKAGGHKVNQDEVKPQPKTIKLKPEQERLATKELLLEKLKSGPPQLLDARSKPEYCGDLKTAQRSGAIPGSVHLEWVETVDPSTKRFRTPDELAKLFKERQVDLDSPAVTYCQSGGRAAVLAFALELMGGKQVRNYYQSWAEWGNAEDTPIVKPEPKKP
jgi:thiosulfate/3-mercaptopyruvate sulfurtransferase